MATKMSDVAKLAKVSTATVSRVLTDDPRVTSRTRRRVLEAVQTLEYKPNRLASNFRKNSSRTVLVVLPDITNPFFSEIVQGFEAAALERDYHVLLGDTRNSLVLERDFIQLATERFVDGLVLATARLSKQDLLPICEQIPVVLACEYLDDIDLSTVSIDNVEAARTATQHLMDLGHERIGFVTGSLNVILSRDRLRGFREAHLLRGFAVDGTMIVEGDFVSESGEAAVEQLLNRNPRPTAIAFSGDQMAIGALRALRRKGIRVPEDISVIGFDDVPMCQYVQPELTTIHQPKFEIGLTAMNLLLDIIEQKSKIPKRIILPHRLIQRDSTARCIEK